MVWDVHWPDEPQEPHILMGWCGLPSARPDLGLVPWNCPKHGKSGANRPMGTSELICLHQSIPASMASI